MWQMQQEKQNGEGMWAVPGGGCAVILNRVGQCSSLRMNISVNTWGKWRSWPRREVGRKLLELVIERMWPLVDPRVGRGSRRLPHLLPAPGINACTRFSQREPFSGTPPWEHKAWWGPSGLNAWLNPAKASASALRCWRAGAEFHPGWGFRLRQASR